MCLSSSFSKIHTETVCVQVVHLGRGPRIHCLGWQMSQGRKESPSYQISYHHGQLEPNPPGKVSVKKITSQDYSKWGEGSWRIYPPSPSTIAWGLLPAVRVPRHLGLPLCTGQLCSFLEKKILRQRYTGIPTEVFPSQSAKSKCMAPRASATLNIYVLIYECPSFQLDLTRYVCFANWYIHRS